MKFTHPNIGMQLSAVPTGLGLFAYLPRHFRAGLSCLAASRLVRVRDFGNRAASGCILALLFRRFRGLVHFAAYRHLAEFRYALDFLGAKWFR